MDFTHCDHNEKHISLHDCIAERVCFENGKLIFEFSDGFWISPNHPKNNLSDCVRTDAARVEYTLEDGKDYDVTIYVFKKTFGKKVVRTEWTVQRLVDEINTGKCKLEFLYQYLNERARMIECELRINKAPYHQECMMWISAPEVSYYWNRLREDRTW